jgi:hypothetical protein
MVRLLAKLERIKIVKEQAKVIVTETGDAPATQMAEAASTLAMQMVMEILTEADKGKLENEKLTDVLKALHIRKKCSCQGKSKASVPEENGWSLQKLRERNMGRAWD